MITPTYSPVTKSVTEIESTYAAHSPKIIARSKKAYSLSTGAVVYIGEDDASVITVVVQYDATTVFVYGMLTEAKVELGEIIESGQLIGNSDGRISFGTGIRIGIADTSSVVTNSVRIGGQSFGYVDPIRWFDGSIQLNDVIFDGFTFSKDTKVEIISEEMNDEFDDGSE